MPVYLTTEEVAAHLRVSPVTVRWWWREGSGPPGLKIGRRVLYPIDQFEVWIRSHAKRDTNAVPVEASRAR